MKHLGLFIGLTLAAITGVRAEEAERILKESGVTGGLVVHVGCGDGLLTAALRANPGYIVQGLDANSENVELARETIRSKGLSGPISVKHWTEDHLPYVDNVVNLLVDSREDSKLSRGEIMRVLAPRGVAIVDGEKLVKPVPDEIDEWTHYLHDADNNAVAQDSAIGPPRYLRWRGGPKYSRNHEIDSSVVAVVSAQGRFFYIVDEGLPGFMGKYLPQTWALVARDAFNGVILWKKPVPEMGWPQWKPQMASTDWSRLVAQRRLIPITLPRRLVAVGDRTFVTLGYHAPLTILDSATGRTIKTCNGTPGTDEILHCDDMLILCVRPNNRASLDPPNADVLNRNDRLATNHPSVVMAVDPCSGKVFWETASDKLLPLTLTVGGDRVFFHTGAAMVALDRKTGKQLWSTPDTNVDGKRWNVSHTVISHSDVLLLGTPRKLEAFSAKTGELLWEAQGGRSGFAGSNPTNVYVIDGMVWAPSKACVGLDLRSGEVKRELELPKYMYTAGHHFRCYRGKATERYLLENKRGIEMIDLEGKEFVKNDWVRGMCRYGVMPCNGLIYSTPTPCSCYPTVLLTGFNALASRLGDPSARKGVREGPLLKGPAYANAASAKTQSEDTDAWPTFRADALRNGATRTKVAGQPTLKWRTKLGGATGSALKLSQPMVAGGKLFVASVDEQTIHALDADTGDVAWSRTVDGRVDSPPTYHNGMIVFGSRNGWIYCLRASDGQLAWQRRLAPSDEQIVSYNQLESVWPAHGSTLILDGVVYAAAGRNVYLDDGIHVVAIDAATGKILHEAHLKKELQDPATDPSHCNTLDGAKLDVLASDGKYIFMQGKVLDRTLKEIEDETQQSGHIYTTAGYLDNLAWNRNAWKYALTYPALNKKNLSVPFTGQILSVDEKMVYGIKYFLGHSGQSSVFYPGEDGYLLFADRIGDRIAETSPAKRTRKKGRKGKGASAAKGTAVEQDAVTLWKAMIPIRVRAMVKTSDALWIAGPPDVVDKEDPLAAFEGRKGAILRAYSADDGTQGFETRLDSPPVFDGLIAADRKLYIALRDGSVACWQ